MRMGGLLGGWVVGWRGWWVGCWVLNLRGCRQVARWVDGGVTILVNSDIFKTFLIKLALVKIYSCR